MAPTGEVPSSPAVPAGQADAPIGADAGLRVVDDEPADEGVPPPEPVAVAADPIPVPPAPDPEQILATYRWWLHPDRLREEADDPEELRELHQMITRKLGSATDNASRARLLGARATVSRILGDLGKALADGKLAVAHAQATGELVSIGTALARLAPVLHWRGEFDKAEAIFAQLDRRDLPEALRASVHEAAGRSCYDQGRYLEACDHFGHALRLSHADDLALIARLEVAVAAVFSRVSRDGWGPYPRRKAGATPAAAAPSATVAPDLPAAGGG